MVGSIVLTFAPDEHFLRPANVTGANETLMEVDVEAREAQRITLACTMTVLVGLFQVKLFICVIKLLSDLILMLQHVKTKSEFMQDISVVYNNPASVP